MPINQIHKLCAEGAVRWTNHALVRLLQRSITSDDVICALQNGEIIESYPQDYPNPSYLVLGLNQRNQFLHIVCGIAETELWIITAYYPNRNEWESDYKTRRIGK